MFEIIPAVSLKDHVILSLMPNSYIITGLDHISPQNQKKKSFA